jgi:RNA polymerase sigma factor (sigma-70 family)
MSQQTIPDSAAPSDPELIAAVRAGDGHAYGVLFERHRGAALNLARQIAGSSDADDLVSDAFIKVLRVLSAGGGPDVAFRAYLLTAVRRLHIDKIRASSKVTPSDDLEQFDPGIPFQDTVVDNFENAAAAKAFASLPERWQLVLWHIEVEGQKPAEVAPLLGMSPNSVSALAYRAREGLRQAYVQMHMADTGDEECRWVTERLGAHVRKGLSRRDAAKVDEHLDECRKCAAVYLELTEVNSNLSGILAPALLGTAAAGYLASTAGGAAVSATGITTLLLKARHLAKAHTAMTVGGTAGGLVAAGVATVFVTQVFTRDIDNRADVRTNTPAITAPASTSGTAGTGPSTSPSSPPPSSAPPSTSQEPSKNPPTRPGETTTPPGTGGPTVPVPTPTAPVPTPTSGPIVVVEIPNTDEDDPPAPHNSDDPGLPQVPVPPPTTTPPPPPLVDVSVSIDVNRLSLLRYFMVIDTNTEEPATNLVMNIDVSEYRVFVVLGWNCENPGGDSSITCTTNSADPADLRIFAVFPRGSVPTLTATVTAIGYDEDPADLGNNVATWSGAPAPVLGKAAKLD